MTLPTMAEAQEAAQAMDAQIDTMASNGLDGVIFFNLPGLTVEQAREAVDSAFGGRSFDAGAITISRDRLEESDLPVAAITIKTMEI